MPDTARTEAALLALFADNTSGDISPQDLRDFLVSLGSSRYSVDSPPATANAADDEFPPGSLAGAWTEWDPASVITPTVEDYGLKLSSSASGFRYGGVHKALPGGTNWYVTTRADFVDDRTANVYAGMILAGDISGSPTTAGGYMLATLYGGSGIEVSVHSFTNYQTFGSNVTTKAPVLGRSLYFRIAKIGSTYRFLTSDNGIGWHEIHSTSSPSPTPARVGLAVASDRGASLDTRGIFGFWREVDSSDYLAPVAGRRIL
jgi:hypothetical protein